MPSSIYWDMPCSIFVIVSVNDVRDVVYIGGVLPVDIGRVVMSCFLSIGVL